MRWMRLALFLLLATGCSQARSSLVDVVDQSDKNYRDAHYASFVVEGEDSGQVDVAGETRPAVIPPFPATLRFPLDVPEAGFLTFAPALVTRQRVGRARVEFTVTIDADGERVQAFSELFRHTDANQWHEREIDLERWAGRRVTVELSTREEEGRTDMLWADRVQTVWGDPVVASSYEKQLALSIGDLTASTSNLLSSQAKDAGLTQDDVSDVGTFAVNLLIGGLLSIGIREVYKQFGTTPSGRDQFGNLFPLFTITTIVVIAVVRSSLALSLGLIGALSIVRFRSAIKSPEELAYLLFCASVGIALGAEQRLLAVTSVVLVCGFAIARSFWTGRIAEKTLLLTIAGDATRFYKPDDAPVLERVQSVSRRLRLQRLDHDGERVELRAVVSVGDDEAETWLSRLRAQLPELEFSCVDADDVL